MRHAEQRHWIRNNRSILLVEDDEVDVLMVQRALRDLEVENPLRVASNGEVALTLLQDEEEDRPALILLDLNMPRMGGLDFLRALRQTDAANGIPVVVLSTSRQDRDVLESFNMNIAGYMVKPVDYQKFVELMRTIDQYWTLSELPP
jgi:CheY-like chemotaxis protein